jgi:hypothetical protein
VCLSRDQGQALECRRHVVLTQREGERAAAETSASLHQTAAFTPPGIRSFWGDGVGDGGLNSELHGLSHTSSAFCSGYFGDGGSQELFVRAGLEPRSF